MSEEWDADQRDSRTNLPVLKLSSAQCLRSLQKQLDDARGLTGWIIADIDNFLALNAYVTHRVGDLVLKEIAIRLSDVLGVRGVVSRIGGDEFLAMLPDIGAVDEVQGMAVKMLRAFDSPVEIGKDAIPLIPSDTYTTPYPGIDGHAVKVTMSLGLTVSKPGDEVSAVLNDADVAMFASKAQGRARASASHSEWTSN
jgi:diguanylate cyclase (GGDEF)-like protein